MGETMDTTILTVLLLLLVGLVVGYQTDFFRGWKAGKQGAARRRPSRKTEKLIDKLTTLQRQEIGRAMYENDKTDAIRQFRAATGADQRTATEAIEYLD